VAGEARRVGVLRQRANLFAPVGRRERNSGGLPKPAGLVAGVARWVGVSRPVLPLFLRPVYGKRWPEGPDQRQHSTQRRLMMPPFVRAIIIVPIVALICIR